MSEFWNIALIFFALTGALCWLCMILLTVFFWMCQRPPEKE